MEQMSPAELFPHVRIVMGMIVGLGITRLLMTVAGLVQHPKCSRVSAIHLLWIASILVELVLFWWWEFALFRLEHWTFAITLFLILYAVTLFLLAANAFSTMVRSRSPWAASRTSLRPWSSKSG